MASFPGATANFNEPQTDDPTSAPSMQVPQGAQQPASLTPRAQSIAGGLAQALAKRKKTGLIGPTIKAPAQLAAAIARAKRAHQSGDKFG